MNYELRFRLSVFASLRCDRAAEAILFKPEFPITNIIAVALLG